MDSEMPQSKQCSRFVC